MNDLMTDSFVGDQQKSADIESGSVSSNGNSDPSLNRFFAEAESAKQEMLSIQSLLSQINKENEAKKAEHRREILRSLSARINDEVIQTVKKARNVRSKLQSMDRKVDKKDRNRVSVVRGLSMKLREIMGEVQGLRGRMIEENREAVKRCYYTITGEKPSEEVIEEIMSSGVHAEELLLKKAVSDQGDQGVVRLVEEMEDRQESAREVEKSLFELQQLFLDMSVLVETQGNQIDQIEHHVDLAAGDVASGAQSLEEANVQQKKARKTLCWFVIIILVLIVLVVDGVIIWFSVVKKSSGVGRIIAPFLLDFVNDRF